MRKTEEKNKFIRPLAATTISLPPSVNFLSDLIYEQWNASKMFFDFFFSTFF